jgi:hypothetical protein
VQHFVGAGARDNAAVLAELRRQAAEELGEPAGVLVLDPSGGDRNPGRLSSIK